MKAIIRIGELALLASIALLLAVSSWDATSRWMETGSPFLQEGSADLPRARVETSEKPSRGSFFKAVQKLPAEPHAVERTAANNRRLGE